MKNAQKIIRRDPDLMTSMQININDSDIATAKEEKKDGKKDVKPEDVHKDDIITFVSDDPQIKGMLNTHRVIDIA